MPLGASWSEEFLFVCFDNECSYYKEGWRWMRETYNQHASYRYMFNPVTKASSMIPVWSESATRELIMEDPAGEDE